MGQCPGAAGRKQVWHGGWASGELRERPSAVRTPRWVHAEHTHTHKIQPCEFTRYVTFYIQMALLQTNSACDVLGTWVESSLRLVPPDKPGRSLQFALYLPLWVQTYRPAVAFLCRVCMLLPVPVLVFSGCSGFLPQSKGKYARSNCCKRLSVSVC